MRTIRVKIEKLRLDDANVLSHQDRDIDAIARSLEAFGQQKPIVVSADNWVAAGNGTVLAARSLGWTEVNAVRSQLSADRLKAYSVADNQTGRLAAWDHGNLADRLEEIRQHDEELIASVGLPESDLRKLLKDWQGDLPDWESSEFERLADREESPPIEPPVDPKTKPGDLWALGDHRLLCGDCRNWDDVDRLLNGARINVAVTSPPYADRRKYDEGSEFQPIPPEQYVEWFKAVADNVEDFLAADGSFFLNIEAGASNGVKNLHVWELVLLLSKSWLVVDEFCWPRPSLPINPETARRFKNAWESVFHFAKHREFKFRPRQVTHRSDGVFSYKDQVAAGKLIGGDAQGKGGGLMSPVNQHEGQAYPSNVLKNGGGAKVVGHSAAFPVLLPMFFIAAFSDRSDVVFDPFLGSGSTLIASEELGRICFGTEISPRYCDVIVSRWESHTGKQAQLIGVANA